MIKGISHLGVAVKDLQESRNYYKTIFGLESSDPILSGDGLNHVSMIETGNVIVEILQPIGEEGVMAKFLAKRGEGIHHICYDVDDIHAEVSSLKAKGMEILGEPKPGAEGMSVFLHPRGTHGILIELVQKQ